MTGRGYQVAIALVLAAVWALALGYGYTTGDMRFLDRAEGAPEYEERLCVYDRQGQPCPVCRTPIRRIVQAARSTFYCPRCQ